MRTLGPLLLLAGTGVALFLYLPAPSDSGSPNKLYPPARNDEQSFDAVPSGRGDGGYFQPPQTPTSPPAPMSPEAAEAPSDWQTAVSIDAPETTTAVLPKTLAPTDPDTRYKLVLDIQQLLRRAGCYWSLADGSWGPMTQDAMKEFSNRVNATLPRDEPDYIQLQLLQSHRDTSCGACPAGQSLAASGRCVGLSLRAEDKNLGAPNEPAQKEVLPWKATLGPEGGQPLFKSMPSTIVSTEPLPERMGIGGPSESRVDVPTSITAPAPATAPQATITAGPEPNAPAARAPVAERRARPDHRSRFAHEYGSWGPGTPRYNLLLSLGGLR